MRTLNETNSTMATTIMAAIKEVMGDLPVKTFSAKILNSDEEGKYGWLTVNYLKQKSNLSVDNQIGALDWGGSSSQITFAIPNNSTAAENMLEIGNITVFNQTVEVFTKSDACYGQAEALKRYYGLIIKAKFDDSGVFDVNNDTLEAPCQPEGNSTKDNFFTFKAENLFGSDCGALVDGSFKVNN
jgi:Golgi nucleoside diphosphatase